MGIPKELVIKILKLNNEGYSTGEIARMLNIDEYVVVLVLRKN